MRRRSQHGGALLAVLWLSVAMTAIAFALSRGVRSELDRASLNVDSTKAYFLAQGAIEATMRRIARPLDQEHPERNFEVGLRFLRFDFPSGSMLANDPFDSPATDGKVTSDSTHRLAPLPTMHDVVVDRCAGPFVVGAFVVSGAIHGSFNSWRKS